MGKECGAWVSRRLWGGGNTSPLKTTAWEAKFWADFNDSNFRMMSYVLNVLVPEVSLFIFFRFRPLVNDDRKPREDRKCHKL